MQKERNLSPQLNPTQNKKGSLERLKANSIFAFTSLGHQLGPDNKAKINSKRQALKLNLESR